MHKNRNMSCGQNKKDSDSQLQKVKSIIGSWERLAVHALGVYVLHWIQESSVERYLICRAVGE